jgi:hypothetical protein
MAIKKSELYSSLWKSCDELRGVSSEHLASEQITYQPNRPESGLTEE